MENKNHIGVVNCLSPTLQYPVILNSTQLNEHLWTQVSHTSVPASIYSLMYNKNYNKLILWTNLSPIPVKLARLQNRI